MIANYSFILREPTQDVETQQLVAIEPYVSILGATVTASFNGTSVIVTETLGVYSFSSPDIFTETWKEATLELIITKATFNTYRATLKVFGQDLGFENADAINSNLWVVYLTKETYPVVINTETYLIPLTFSSIFSYRKPLTDLIYLIDCASGPGTRKWYETLNSITAKQITSTTRLYKNKISYRCDSEYIYSAPSDSNYINTFRSFSVGSYIETKACTWFPQILGQLNGEGRDNVKELSNIETPEFDQIIDFSDVSNILINGTLVKPYTTCIPIVKITDINGEEQDLNSVKLAINFTGTIITSFDALPGGNTHLESNIIYDDLAIQFKYLALVIENIGDYKIEHGFLIADTDPNQDTITEDTIDQFAYKYLETMIFTGETFFKVLHSTDNSVIVKNLIYESLTVEVYILERKDWVLINTITLDAAEQTTINHTTDGVYMYTATRNEEIVIFTFVLYSNVENCLLRNTLDLAIPIQECSQVDLYKQTAINISYLLLTSLIQEFYLTTYVQDNISNEKLEKLWTIDEILQRMLNNYCVDCSETPVDNFNKKLNTPCNF